MALESPCASLLITPRSIEPGVCAVFAGRAEKRVTSAQSEVSMRDIVLTMRPAARLAAVEKEERAGEGVSSSLLILEQTSCLASMT